MEIFKQLKMIFNDKYSKKNLILLLTGFLFFLLCIITIAAGHNFVDDNVKIILISIGLFGFTVPAILSIGCINGIDTITKYFIVFIVDYVLIFTYLLYFHSSLMTLEWIAFSTYGLLVVYVFVMVYMAPKNIQRGGMFKVASEVKLEHLITLVMWLVIFLTNILGSPWTTFVILAMLSIIYISLLIKELLLSKNICICNVILNTSLILINIIMMLYFTPNFLIQSILLQIVVGVVMGSLVLGGVVYITKNSSGATIAKQKKQKDATKEVITEDKNIENVE